MNVFLVKFEGVAVFSSARKAIEYIKGFEYQESYFYLDGDYENQIELNSIPTEKLITRLNKGEILVLNTGGHDCTEIFKEQVR